MIDVSARHRTLRFNSEYGATRTRPAGGQKRTQRCVFRLWSGYALPSPEHTPSPLILIDAEALKLIVAQHKLVTKQMFVEEELDRLASMIW